MALFKAGLEGRDLHVRDPGDDYDTEWIMMDTVKDLWQARAVRPTKHLLVPPSLGGTPPAALGASSLEQWWSLPSLASRRQGLLMLHRQMQATATVISSAERGGGFEWRARNPRQEFPVF
jgi:hypothetical protein